MRAAEVLLSLSNLLTLLVLAVPRRHAARWMGYVVLAPLAMACAQVLMEGPRWQMAPAYLLTGLCLPIGLLQSLAPVGGILEQRLTHRFTTGFAVIVATLALGFSAALPIVLPVFRFPRPTGPYEIGTLTYHWTDVSRHEVFSTDESTRRELVVQAWYPAHEGSSSSRARYLQDSDAVTTALARLHDFPEFSLRHLKYVKTNAVDSAHVADDEPSYPVLIFLEGLTGYRQMNTFQVEELASQGYIVVGIDQPGVAASVVFPDGHEIAGLSKPQMDPLTQQSVSPAAEAPLLNGAAFKHGLVPYFVRDISFALDQLASINDADPKGILTGKVDLERTGMFGVSFGGIVAAEACLKEPRVEACLVMDVVMTAEVVQKGLRQPSMWITRDADTMRLERQRAGGWTERDIEQTQTTMRAVYDNLPGDGYFVQVPGMFHIDLTDLTYVSPIFSLVGFSGPIDSHRAHSIINAYSLAFFDRHLRGKPAALLNGPAAQYPEVIFEKRRP